MSNEFTDKPKSIKEKLAELREQHRDLDELITQITAEPASDQLRIKRLKKKKLMLKDLISLHEGKLHPDIIA